MGEREEKNIKVYHT